MDSDILERLKRLPEDPKRIITFILDSIVGISKDLEIGKIAIKQIQKTIENGETSVKSLTSHSKKHGKMIASLQKGLKKVRKSLDVIEIQLPKLESSATETKDLLKTQQEEITKINQALDSRIIMINGKSISEILDELSLQTRKNQDIIEGHEKSIRDLNKVLSTTSHLESSTLPEAKVENELLQEKQSILDKMHEMDKRINTRIDDLRHDVDSFKSEARGEFGSMREELGSMRQLLVLLDIKVTRSDDGITRLLNLYASGQQK